VAVDPPKDVRNALADWARSAIRAADARARGGTPPRLLDPESLHVTLCFLGERPTEEIDSLSSRLATCGGPTGELSLGAPLWLPPRRPRTLAVELHDEQGRLASLQKAVAAALEELEASSLIAEGRPNPPAKHRHYRPHVTVARMRSDAAPRERTLPPTPALSFLPAELVLYRSWLSPDGASYEPLASYAID